ncbi:phage tail protein I [Pigmentiphaga sp. CHJ604]|uniref:phage tail protein I n=1 Tax=Pigmentiphaga sp. CHJ604 TaxID=3081984 RepID=UPI0030D55262
MVESLLPDNATELEAALAASTARLDDLPVRIREIGNPATAPAAFLPWLAWAFSVDVEWDLATTDAQKRAVITGSVSVHRRKGTVAAVQAALDALGFDVQLQEWFNQIPAAAPYTYRLIVTADQVGYSRADLRRLIRVVDAAKNLRSHLSELEPRGRSMQSCSLAMVPRIGCDLTITGLDDLHDVTFTLIDDDGSPLVDDDGAQLVDG